MEEYIRQLPHDNQQLQDQWPEIFKRLQELSNDIPAVDKVSYKVKALDALVDYVIADTEEAVQIKITFLEITMKNLINDPLPTLDQLVRIFCRVLQINDTNNLLNFTFIRKFYYTFQLGAKLTALPSVELITVLLDCLEKHDFLDRNFQGQMQNKWSDFLSRGICSPLSCDTNKLNTELTVPQMLSEFQQLYRCAARHSQESHAWSGVQCALGRTFPTLFDSYTNPADAQVHLNACIEPPISLDYVTLITIFYKEHADSFQKDVNQIYVAIEKVVTIDKLTEAERFMDNVIIPHFNSIPNLEKFLQLFIRLCSTVRSESRSKFCKNLISPISYELSKKKFPKKLAGLFFDFILAILDLHISKAPASACRILEISEFYPWKQLDKQLTHLIQSCIAYDQITLNSSSDELERLQSILQLIQQRAKTNSTILHATHEDALRAILKWSAIVNSATGKPYDTFVFEMGQSLTELVELPKITTEHCVQFLDILQKRVDQDDEADDLSQAGDYFLNRVANLLGQSIEQLKVLPMVFHQKLTTFCLAAFNCSLKKESGAMTFAHTAVIHLWFKLIQCLQSEDEVRCYEPCADRLYQLTYEEGEKDLYHWWTTFWAVLTIKYPNVAANHISQFLEDTIDHKQFYLISFLPMLYAKQPEPLHARLDDLIHALFEDNCAHIVSLVYVFSTITKAHPELVTAAQVDYIFTSMNNHSNTYGENGLLFQSLGYIASAQPHLLDKYRDKLIHLITEEQNLQVFLCFQQYLVASTILQGEKAADENLTVLISLLRSTKKISSDLNTQIFHTCQLIGIRYKTVLANKRIEFISFESNPTCRMLIDLIDGNKMSEENQTAINRTLEEMNQIEQRVVHTERNVENISKVVKRQELNITNLGERVDIVDTRVNNVIEQVEQHSREIERLDAKTLSYVPSAWGRDVCILLNVRAGNDWRLLGKRFGYSSSELKHWAMQIDPSMSLLNEWFMTHKADEATYGLVKMLHEIGREDVEEMIRKAMIAVGELIPDDLPMEIKRCPPVFLSYQWGSQQAVLKLKTNLEQAGYACWMDVEQMGGGDKLFAQIDAGIRGAKVVICCMNTAYAQSDNCSREVHLTISTGKALIPLQMEKQTWPPEGALGPIMSEYLFIRFYDRKGNDPNAWPADKFMELLGQIRYHVAPDPDMITEQYQNWFVPRIDHLIFLQPTSTANGTNKQTPITDDTPLIVTHPQIMISYQWDYQTDIVKLYEKLTKLGYCCWLDIFQMGGGDSLFEKIDAGIRHSKCVLACVTPKYTKSINCRREMALADVLKKPIVPLFLEETSSWPPAGPMAMVFAEKSYIDFRRADSKHGRWTGKEFQVLLAQLQQTIPEVQTERPQRHILAMQRPTTAMKKEEKKVKRIGSAPAITQSRACSIM